MLPDNIRNYRPEDREACLAIFRSNIPKFFTEGEEQDYRGWLDELDGIKPAAPDNGHYYVLEVSGTVLGCGGWGIRDGADHATLIWGAVHKDYQGLGLGDALTRYRLDAFLKEHPAFDMTIDTSQHTAAFYERFGFRTQKITEDGYAKGLHRYDMRLLR